MSGECDACGNHCLECDCNEFSATLQSIARILDAIDCECSSRGYHLTDDEMGSVFYCRDLAQKTIKEHKSKLLLKKNMKDATQQDEQ